MVLGIIDGALHEAMLFAGAGLLLGGVDDLAVDFAYFGRLFWRRRSGAGSGLPTLADLPAPATPGRLAVFVPAWDESAVIGAMLRLTLARFRHADYRLYVGCYPNDPATIAVVGEVAAADARVRPVVGLRAGPTTKADCLNTLWRAMLADDAAEGRRTRAVVFHDAEDVVPADGLAIIDALLGEHEVVQLPVLPLPHPESRLVSGTYLDEFAESHSKTLVVRELVGAGLPLAGVGCAIATGMLERIATERGAPFDADSLVEDYELGLRVAALGGRAAFARIAETEGGPVVAVREYFPHHLDAAVKQKARWMAGIAFAGWDRTGWARGLAIGDHWMRLRDRRAPLAALVLCAAYGGLLLWGAGLVGHWWTGTAGAPVDGWLALLLRVNGVLLAWRAGMRCWFTGRAYGGREAAWSLVRLPVGNLIALLAARRALTRYLGMLGGRAMPWEKTAHAFPVELGGADPA